jgi:hypothetical protein
MSDGFPTFGEGSSGATMRPQYMGRIMTTYPVSEPELENISTLSSQITARLSVASFLLALALGIWTSAIFATELTPAGNLASVFVAPLLLLFAVGYGVAAFISRRNRASAWERIKSDALPIPTIAEAGGLMVSGARPPGRPTGRGY